MKKQSVLKKVVLALIAAMFIPLTYAQDASLDDTYRASAVDVPQKGKILIITDNNYNDTELLYPYYRFIEAGYEVTIATMEGGDVAGYNSAPVKNTLPVDQVEESAYDALYLPGGHAPARLRDNKVVLEKVKHFIDAGKPVAAICHGPQILARLGVLKGKQVTAWPGIEEEMKTAGAAFVNKPVVKDGMLITARMPGDLPPHLHAFLSLIEGQ